ncbi:MAG: TadE/TadG family type IV pilus assembly protein [Novosphingobium sp.]|uniref:pilus assembly protein TadG-related protein n=1 Tax=Novosphingobium sp. TaxID=1874826 RepID=UPI0032BEA1D0
MSEPSRKARPTNATSLLGKLARDNAGNTLAMIAAAIIPLMALVGGGVDMGRSYLAQSRLQQACDSGVLAARKKLGTTIALTGTPPANVKTVGDAFFNQNFRTGAYATKNRSFTMTLEADYAITGVAHVDVPTTIMGMFGYKNVSVDASCQAKLNFSNTDVMFVLDTTGSMRSKNDGDTVSKLDGLKQVVRNFHTQMEGSKSPGTRLRYGFVPYSNNVNVGFSLKSDWLVDDWNYNGRIPRDTGKDISYNYNDIVWTYVSGTSTWIAPYDAESCPDDDFLATYTNVVDNPDGSGTGTVTYTGSYYYCDIGADGSTFTISGTTYDSYTSNYVRSPTMVGTRRDYEWTYKPVSQNLAFLKGPTGNDPPVSAMVKVKMYGSPSPNPGDIDAWFRGCVEERDTYEIDNYSSVDLSKALDLDIDLVPTKGNAKTQWRPMLNEISFEPEIWWDGSGTFKSPANSPNDYLMAGWAGLSGCPAPARKLAEMTSGDVNSYLDTLVAEGSTYHDIGMIWGGRLLSPTGLFASDNVDVGGKTTSRHMIFLTDGLTMPMDIAYGTYGIEPLDGRRWNPKSPKLGLTLTQVVEKRFGVACEEVKKRNITVWVIGFGMSLNPIMTDCAGAGHFFEAKNSAELNDIFSKIAAQMGDLRISK